jgi:hypothetical protein
MKKIAAFVLLFISANLFAQNEAVEDTAATPVITAAGRSNGKKTEIKITKDGGSLKSSDGMVELIFPIGAVSKKTDISIQPITNLMTNGNGAAYRFEPSGIQFQKPVQLIFHYDEEEVRDSSQLLLGIAMQDERGQWFSLKKFTLDTVQKTVSGEINHFSDWTRFEAIKLYPSYARVKVRKQLDLNIDLASSESEELSPLGNDPMLTPLRNRNIRWTAAWRASAGTIERQSKTMATFTAPVIVPNQNPVAVTASLTGLNYNYRGTTFNNLRLVSNILIYDNAYEVTMISEIQNPGAGTNLGAVIYKDTGSFVVSLNSNQARIIERVNRNTSAVLDYSGGCCYNYRILKTGHGNIHIAGTPVIKVTPPAVAGRSAMIEIRFARVPSIFPLFQVTCQCPGDKKPYTGTNAQGIAMMAGMLPAFPIYVLFEAKEGEQTILVHGTPGGDLYAKFTVKKLSEEE